MKELNWGIMSTASIARKHIIPAIQNVRNNKIGAIASRSQSKAKKMADNFNIKKVYDSYDQLINDKKLDIIYIPLPNTFHKKWTIKALEKKKHVLCEKPLGIDATEVKEMIEKAKKENQMLMEGFMYRYQPFIYKLKRLIQDEIGELRFLDINLCYKSTRPSDDIRFNKSVGGGSLYDVGCYTVDLARLIMGGKPKEVYNTFSRIDKNKVDHTGKALLRYENDITVNLTYSFNSFAHKDFTAVGSQGKIIVKDLFEWFPEDDRTIELITDEQYEIFTFKTKNPYVLEIEGIYDQIINQKALPEDLNASLDNMIIIDHLFESAKNNMPVKL